MLSESTATTVGGGAGCPLGSDLTSVTIEGCAAEGKYPVKGFTIGEATSETEAFKVVQEVNGNETTAAMSGLKFGANAASITGEIEVELSGANAGNEWGAEHF